MADTGATPPILADIGRPFVLLVTISRPLGIVLNGIEGQSGAPAKGDIRLTFDSVTEVAVAAPIQKPGHVILDITTSGHLAFDSIGMGHLDIQKPGHVVLDLLIQKPGHVGFSLAQLNQMALAIDDPAQIGITIDRAAA